VAGRVALARLRCGFARQPLREDEIIAATHAISPSGKLLITPCETTGTAAVFLQLHDWSLVRPIEPWLTSTRFVELGPLASLGDPTKIIWCRTALADHRGFAYCRRPPTWPIISNAAMLRH